MKGGGEGQVDVFREETHLYLFLIFVTNLPIPLAGICCLLLHPNRDVLLFNISSGCLGN